ncbi:transcription factor AP-2 epsilon, partial [Elysia marginata]
HTVVLPKTTRPSSPSSNVVVLPSGTSIHIKDLNIAIEINLLVSSSAHSGGKVLNITTPGGRVIATTTKATNVVTVNPKTLHLTAVKSGSVSKPNVIVVQKTQHARFQNPLPGNIRTVTTSALPGTIDKELMGLAHHKDSHGRHVLTTSNPAALSSASGGRPGERRVIITTSGGGGEPVSIIHRGHSDSESKTSSLLAELIQAAGIMPSDASVETVAQGTDPYDFDHPDSGESRVGAQHQMVPASSSQIVLRHAQASSSSSGAGAHHQLRANQHQLDDSNMDSMAEDKGSSQDSDSGAEQVFTLEQAMSLLNKEVVDLTETDNPVVVTPSFSVTTVHTTPQFQASSTTSTNTTSVLPSVLTTASSQPQAKVSILAKSRLLSGVVKEQPSSALMSAITVAPPGTPVAEPGLSGLVTVVSPEEGLKEGQLDTQTGLFYQVGSPAAIKVRAPQQHQAPSDAGGTVAVPQPHSLPVPLSSSVVIVAGPTTPAAATTITKTTTSLSTLPISSLAYRQTPSLPATVTTTTPLAVASSKMPPSTLLSSSLLLSTGAGVATTKTSSQAVVGKSSHPPALDLLSSSLAQAQINFQDQLDEEEGEEEEENDSHNENDNPDEEVDDENKNYEDYDDEGVDDGVDRGEVKADLEFQQSVAGVSDTTTCAGGAGRPGMAEVLREETAKDGTLILTVSNPASSQPEICVPVSSTTTTLAITPTSFSSVPLSSHHHQNPVLVSLPSQLSRAPPAPAIITPQVAHLTSSGSHSGGQGQFYSVLDSQSANPAKAASLPSPALGILPAVEIANLPSTGPLRVVSTPSAVEQQQQSGQQQVGVLPIAVSVEPSGSVITFNLDDLTSQQVLSHGETETNTDIHPEELGSEVDAKQMPQKRSDSNNSHALHQPEPSTTQP